MSSLGALPTKTRPVKATVPSFWWARTEETRSSEAMNSAMDMPVSESDDSGVAPQRSMESMMHEREFSASQ